jgi:hypothetical protein
MKLRAGCVVSAGLLLATAANAEMRAPDQVGRPPYLRQVSDFVEPYEAIPPQLPPPRYAGALLPPQEVYMVLRDAGFAPLGAPRLRGNIWTIAAINRAGDDGRLFIDATNGRILSFMPASDRFDDEAAAGVYDPQSGPPRPPMPAPSMRTFQRPPAAIPHVASRTMPMPQPVTPQPPMPKPVPPAAAARPVAPAPAQSIAVESPPPPQAVAPPPAPAPSTVGQARPAPKILPTQELPKAQDLEY